ncbi:hypothetical protein ACJX0J_042395 [Zea mays]
MKYKLYVNLKGGTKLSLGALISVCYAHQNNMWKHILLLFDGVILELHCCELTNSKVLLLGAADIPKQYNDKKKEKIHFGMNTNLFGWPILRSNTKNFFSILG